MKIRAKKISKTSKESLNKPGSSLIECLVTLLTMTVGMTGMISFRYFCVKEAEEAKTTSLAAYSAHMIAETWASQTGSTNFDLSSYSFGNNLQVSPLSVTDPSLPSDLTQVNYYDVEMEGRHFLTSLAYQDSEDVPNIRNLYISLTWEDKNGEEQNYIVSKIIPSSS